MQLVLRAAGAIALIVSVIWWFAEPGFATLYTFITGLVAFLSSFVIPKQETKGETLDQRNRRVMLDHVENFWIKGVLEKSLHGAALLELGIKEDPSVVNYPWAIKKESTDETLPPGKSMLEIFKEIGMGRSLLILGAPGSGKTTMLLALARQLIKLARKDETEPIPVVFNLASWKEKQTLADWLAEQFEIMYRVPNKTTFVWLKENHVLLLLDGLDEVAAANRAQCIEVINRFRKEYGLTSLIICCRIEEYSLANTKLSLEGAITLQPLTSKQVNAYFDRFGKSLASVNQLLRKDKILRELAETPLMLSIITLAYKDRKVSELISSSPLEDQRNKLFDSYITRMFERYTLSENVAFTKRQTLQYLSWLARNMIQHNIITYQSETMQPSWLTNQRQGGLYRRYVSLSIVLIIGLSGGLIGGLIFGLSGGLISGIFGGLSFGLIVGAILVMVAGVTDRIMMIDRLNWSWNEAQDWLNEGLNIGLIIGLISGLLIAMEDGGTAGLIFGLSVMLIIGLSGLIVGLIIVLAHGYLSLIQQYSLRLVLMRQHLLPRQLIAFLEYTVRLIFLRRVGGSYIFVHRLLMEHFAEMEV